MTNPTTILVNWHKNDIIRDKRTGHPYLVVHVHKNVCSLVVDLEDKRALAPLFALLPKVYDQYALDSDMEYNFIADYKRDLFISGSLL